MGLTVHWKLSFEGDRESVENIVSAVCRKINSTSFSGSNETVLYIKNGQCFSSGSLHSKESCGDSMSRESVDKQRLEWLILLADKNKGEIPQLPEEMYAAIGDPGPGSEKAYFFLGRYSYDNRWEGWGFCKTQYAEYFVESHVLLIEWLDVFRKAEVNIDVFDEGNYWKTRDVATLLSAYERFNAALDNFTDMLQKYEVKIEGAAPDYVKHRKNKLN